MKIHTSITPSDVHLGLVASDSAAALGAIADIVSSNLSIAPRKVVHELLERAKTPRAVAGLGAVGEGTFGRAFNEALVHQVVTAYMAGRRSGTKAQKDRSQVSGGGSKPWRQKGTGRARAGTIRSRFGPGWRRDRRWRWRIRQRRCRRTGAG